MRINSSVITTVFSFIGLHSCEPLEPSRETPPPMQSETISLSELLDVCVQRDFYLRGISSDLIYEEVTDVDIIPIPSKAYFDALKVLDGKVIKKVENTKPFGVDVGHRSGQKYLVRACLDADFRRYFRLPNAPSLQRGLDSTKLGWSIIQNQDILLYQQFVTARTDVLSPAIFILWSEEEISTVKGMIQQHH